MRTFKQIMQEIEKLWANPYFGAVPYIEALKTLDTSDKKASYLFEKAESLVPYLLCNMSTFRGPDARRIKAELKSLIA